MVDERKVVLRGGSWLHIRRFATGAGRAKHGNGAQARSSPWNPLEQFDVESGWVVSVAGEPHQTTW